MIDYLQNFNTGHLIHLLLLSYIRKQCILHSAYWMQIFFLMNLTYEISYMEIYEYRFKTLREADP